jgi:hypothetical protein
MGSVGRASASGESRALKTSVILGSGRKLASKEELSMKRALVLTALIATTLGPASAAAQQIGTTERPTGFALEFDVAATTPIYAIEDFFVTSGWSLAPQLIVGAQIQRFFVGLQTSISFWGTRPEAVRIGPELDGEVWTSRWAALYVGGAITALIYRTENEDYTANGFSIDAKFGGRVWLVPQLAIGLELGSQLDAVFTEIDREPGDAESHAIAWTLYGAFCMRFVADR